MSNWQTPLCKKCGTRHLNFDPCPKAIKMGEGLNRFRAPDGFHTMKGWGAPNTRGVPVFYQMPAKSRHGQLTGADGEPYQP